MPKADALRNDKPFANIGFRLVAQNLILKINVQLSN